MSILNYGVGIQKNCVSGGGGRMDVCFIKNPRNRLRRGSPVRISGPVLQATYNEFEWIRLICIPRETSGLQLSETDNVCVKVIME